MCEKPASATLVHPTQLTFPISRSVLWDHHDVGPPAFLSIVHSRLIHLIFDVSVQMQMSIILLYIKTVDLGDAAYVVLVRMTCFRTALPVMARLPAQ